MRYVSTILRVCLDTRSAWFPRTVIIHVNRVRIDSFVCVTVRLSSGCPTVSLEGRKQGEERGLPYSLKKRERRISVIDIERSRFGREGSIARIDSGVLVRIPC